ncbi:uncharacterized protein UV8b_07318 [Ustilaginoidea virens]|uniref:Peptide N-acetyl-beta-D-glucosaminyl asparaginase amidase A N-terminal domain-containing protein n=1 Tax=Ustilaginoidea virens TaxID=1159556 RepID=A0A8E5MKV9_USTVR|nr:uncharacterized protein UV8b_07318 [Ustilaginoidea virens]QUC23077.1 hypothetical protein UV8b_07318 [Ustilaginoidea virens]
MRNRLWIACLVAPALSTRSVWHGELVRRAVDEAHQQELLIASRNAAGYPATPLQCFQVASPVLAPDGLVDGNKNLGNPRPRQPESCTVTLMDHVFANSYGHPFVADYAPPSPATCRVASHYNRVILNLTVVSEGRQFDRLATMWLGDAEVWRMSTAEPKAHPGIAWTYWKDMTNYLALWRQPQKLIFDLGNLINHKYTGSFNATLAATYIRDEDLSGAAGRPADHVLPISAGRGSSSSQGSAWTYPEQKAEASVLLPRNTRRAVASVAATGQADEEFWWTNVPESGVDTFNGTTLLGKGSFREVRLFIDGQIAGLSWPYPVVFTGGVAPPLHRPMVGPQAFDLREHEIDVTPWLGVLCDGSSHVFSLEVVGQDDLVANKYWVLSGKIFVWLDDGPGHVTSGRPPRVLVSAPDYEPRVVQVANSSLSYRQTTRRVLQAESRITRSNGRAVTASWTQEFAVDARGSLADSGDTQNVTASYRGADRALEDGSTVYHAAYSYPTLARVKQTAPDGRYSLTVRADLTQGMDMTVLGRTAFPNGLEPFAPLLPVGADGSSLATSKTSSAFYWQTEGGNQTGGHGSSHQRYRLAYKQLAGRQGWSVADDDDDDDDSKVVYRRDVSVVNETTTHDSVWVWGAKRPVVEVARPPAAQGDSPNGFAVRIMGGKGRKGREPGHASAAGDHANGWSAAADPSKEL